MGIREDLVRLNLDSSSVESFEIYFRSDHVWSILEHIPTVWTSPAMMDSKGPSLEIPEAKKTLSSSTQATIEAWLQISSDTFHL